MAKAAEEVKEVKEVKAVNTGIESKEFGAKPIKALWTRANKMKVPEGETWQWWPIECVSPDIRYSPRHNGRTNQATVERYSEMVDDLPPIVVNADGRLVDGKHRIEAHLLAEKQFIKVTVVDLNDHELFEAAYLANSRHGEGYTDRERTVDARRIWDARRAASPDAKINQSEFAREMGISRMTINRWEQEEKEGAEEAKAKKKAEAEKKKAEKKQKDAAAAEAAGFHEPDDERPTFRGVTAPEPNDDGWDEDDSDEDVDGEPIFDRIADGINAINELFNESSEIEWDHHLKVLDVPGMNPTIVKRAAESLMKLSLVVQSGIEAQADAEEEGDEEDE